MRPASASFHATVLPFVSRPIFGHTRMRGALARVCGLLAGMVLGACAMAAAQTKTSTTTTLAVTSSGSAVTTVASGSVVTVTGSVKAGTTALTTGRVNFCDAAATSCTDIHLLGTAQLTSAGTARMKFRPGIGSHSYKAVFAGTNTHAGSSSGASALAVTGKFPSVTVIAQSGFPGDYTLTATVTGIVNASGLAAPTGMVSFLDTGYGNSVLRTAALEIGTPGLSFSNSSNPSTVAEPNVVAAADFNGDGIPDLAVSNSNSGQVKLTILLGNGDGTFKATATSPTVGLYPDSVVVGDFNGDGIPDLALTSVDQNEVSVLLGVGDGTFTTAPNLSTVGTPQSVSTGDFNGDGIADLAVVNANSVLIFLGNGDGTFTESRASAPTGASPITVAVGDFNGDGIADLAVVNNCGNGDPCNNANGTITILLGKGDGMFTADAATPEVGPSPVGIAIGDFNGDGILDLAISDYDGYSNNAVTILLGKGDGTFQAPQYYGGTGLSHRSLAVGDFNGDGIADLAIGEFWTGEVSILLGKGDGTFATAKAFSANAPLNSGYIASADFNGDGITDLAEPNQDLNGTVAVLLANPTQTATATANVSSLSGPGPHLVDASYPGDSNYNSSVSGTTSLTSLVATPVISPASGTITSAQSITITDATPGATIYYRTSGATFTNGFVPYTRPIPLEGSGTQNIQAYATETGYQQSGYVSATYTLNFPSAAATPVISLASGSYASAQTVTISDTTPSAQIYYTTNGTYPYTSSNLYSGPITVSTSEVVVAVAFAPGYSGSGYAIARYDIASSSTRFMYTVAGNYTPGYSGDGGPATFAELSSLQGVAVDSAGNVYMADRSDNVVRKVAGGTGIITTVAGTGVAGHTGDNGPAASAELWGPTYLAVDGLGNLFIGETGDSVVRRIDATTGAITTFAGNPTGTGSIGGLAVNYNLYSISGIACDRLGDLYIASGGNVLEVNTGSGNISEVAGLATNAGFYDIAGIAVDNGNNVYVSDVGSRVWKISSGGTATVFAGSQSVNPGGDGGPATQARLDFPAGLAVDAAGNVYIADQFECAIREVNTSGIINTIAGILDVPYAFGGDGDPASNVALLYPQAIAADAAGNVYFVDQYTYRIRKITAPTAPPTTAAAAPVFSLAAGTYFNPQTLTMTDATAGAEIYVSLNGSAPTTSGQGYHGSIDITGTVTVQAVAVAPGFLPSAPVTATYTLPAPPTAVLSTVVGNARYGMLGIGGPATSATIGEPQAVTFDNAGNLYIADPANYVVWMVAASTGNISIVAGTGTQGNGGDGGQATATALSYPEGVAVDLLGNLYISDTGNRRVRMVTATTGVITTIAGPGVSNVLGDGGPATAAALASPRGLAFDQKGNLYIADIYSNRIRMVSAKTGIISTVAGGGTASTLGDGGLATAASVFYPEDVTVDSFGNLFISDSGNARIRKVDASTGLISTIAGNGTFGNTGDGGQATAAEIGPGQGIAVNGAGNLYFSDRQNTIRKVDTATGIITTIAGDGYFGYGGDGGAATMAELYDPQGVAFDASGSLYIADTGNYVVRKLTFPGPAPAPAFSPAAGTYHSVQTVKITDSIQGATIYFTTDGTTPTTASSVYSGSLTVSATETLKAIAVATGYTESAVISAAYTINLPVTPTVTLTPSSSSITTAQPLTIAVAVAGNSTQTPTGSVTLTGGGYTSPAVSLSSGSATISIPAGSLPVGSHTLTVTYTPDTASSNVYSSANQSVTVAVTSAIGSATATVTATPTATTITNVQTLSVKIAVAGGSGQATPTGSVTLASGSYSAQQTLSGGTANFTIAAGALSSGANTLTAIYSGDATYASASATTTVTVSQVTVAIPAPSSVAPGASATATATFSAGSNYSGTMNLTCALTSSPVGAQSLPMCSLNPASIAIAAGGNGTSTLTVNTTAASSAALVRPLRQKLWGVGGGGALLAVMMIFVVPSRRRRCLSMLALVLFAIAAGTIGCGGGGGGGGKSTGPGTPATTAGSYTFTVTGTDSANAAITVSTKVTVTVQ